MNAEHVARWTEVFIPKRFEHATLDTFVGSEGVIAALQAAKRYAEGFDPECREGLLLSGPVAVGKTHLALAIARAIVAKGFWPIVKFWPKVCDEMRDAFRLGNGTRAIKEQLRTEKLLVIDDLGAEALSDWSVELVLNMVNHRYEHCLPTVVTTNLNTKALLSRYGQRTVSRLVEMCDPVSMSGADWRMQRAKQRKTA